MLLLAFNFKLPFLRSRILRYAYISLCLQSNPETSPFSLTVIIISYFSEKVHCFANFARFPAILQAFRPTERLLEYSSCLCRRTGAGKIRALIALFKPYQRGRTKSVLEPEGRHLVDIVVQPVGEEQVGRGNPLHIDLFAGIVGKVVLGRSHLHALAEVAQIFVFERIAVVLGVPGEEDAAIVPGFDDRAARLFGVCEHGQFIAGVDLLIGDKGMAGMGNIEGIVQPLEQGIVLHELFMRVDAEDLLREELLFQAVVIIEPGLSAPADIERAGDVFFGIVEDLLQLFPVIDLGEGQRFDRRARDDQAVEVRVPDLAEALVETIEMRLGDVLAVVTLHLDQRDIDLQRRVGKQTDELRFGLDLGRHEVENGDLNGTDILTHRALMRHDEDILLLQHIKSRDVLGNDDGHMATPVLPMIGFAGGQASGRPQSRRRPRKAVLYLGKGLLDVRPDILDVLNPERKADEIGGHSGSRQGLVGELTVSRAGGMDDRAPQIGHMGDQRHEIERGDKGLAGRAASLQSEGEHSSSAVFQILRSVLPIGEICQHGILDKLDFIAVFQPFCDFQRIFRGFFHTNGQCLGAQIDEKSVHRRHHSAHIAHHLHARLDDKGRLSAVPRIDQTVIALIGSIELGIAGIALVAEVSAVNQQTADRSRMSVQILGRRVQNNVCAQPQRTAVDGRGERVVHGKDDPVPFGNGGKIVEGEHGDGGICDRLPEDQTGIGTDSRLELLLRGVGRHKGRLDPELSQSHVEEVEGAAVDRLRADDMVAGCAQIGDQDHAGGLPG